MCSSLARSFSWILNLYLIQLLKIKLTNLMPRSASEDSMNFDNLILNNLMVTFEFDLLILTVFAKLRN